MRFNQKRRRINLNRDTKRSQSDVDEMIMNDDSIEDEAAVRK